MRSHHATAGRQAGWLFVVAGAIGLVNDALPGLDTRTRIIAVGLDLLNVGIGLAALWLPWERWAARWTLSLPVLALANLGLNLHQDVLPASTIGVWLVLVFVWVGQWHRPGTPLLMAPVAALAFAVPLVTGGASVDAVTGVGLGVPVAVLVGETIARKESATRTAQAGQDAAIAALAAANLTDDLTGVGNRRRANLLLDSLADGDALAILDLDLFKDVNDSFGHDQGDRVLQDLGAYLASAVRGADAVARFGGEEFVVVLRSASVSAPATVERLLAGWRDTGPLVTLSAGVAVHHAGRSSRDTFADADGALYAAKAGGRDRLVTAA